jgi:hypothetical protein
MFTRWFWTRLTVAVVQRTNVIQAHRPAAPGDTAIPMPMARRYPGLEESGLSLSEVTPPSEAISSGQRMVLRFVLAMKERLRLGSAYPEPYDQVGPPYPAAFESLAPPPQLPEDFGEGRDPIAGVALRGPFSINTRKVGDHFELDMRHIEAFTPRPPFVKVGGLAVLERRGEGMATKSITLEGVTLSPGDAGYEALQRRFLAGVNAHETFIEHLIYCHMIVSGPFAMATHAVLAHDHPLRQFIQPFIIETMRVNNDNIDGLILTENSNVPSYTGFSLDALKKIIVAVSKGFDLRTMDPEWRAKDQGTLGEAGFVTLESRIELWRVFQATCLRYVREGTAGVDAVTIAWCKKLDELVPNGIKTYAGVSDWDQVTVEQLASILALFTYSSSVTHHMVADTTRNYMLSAHLMPPAVAETGRPILGMVLEKMNSIVIAGVLRFKLLDDGVPFQNDAQRAIWKEFQGQLQAIQRDIEAKPATRPYRLEPNRVPSSIHA